MSHWTGILAKGGRGELRRLMSCTTQVFRALFQTGVPTPGRAESPTGFIGGTDHLTRNGQRKRYQGRIPGSALNISPVCQTEEELNNLLVFSKNMLIGVFLVEEDTRISKVGEQRSQSLPSRGDVGLKQALTG